MSAPACFLEGIMSDRFIDITSENIDSEHLCCIIRTKKPHPGVETKRAWLRDRLGEGHVFRKLDEKACVFIEYAPLESAWVPIVGDNYIYIYCLWVLSENKGKGYGSRLMESCIADAKVYEFDAAAFIECLAKVFHRVDAYCPAPICVFFSRCL